MLEKLDLPLILVILTVVTGVIWLIDYRIFRPARLESGAEQPVIAEYAQSFFPVLLIVLALRSFLFEPFRIPSGSMIPTLLVGDYILVNKYSYGLRLPVLDTEIINLGRPERGEVAVFRYPEDPGQDFIKRVIGLPGDEITYDGRQFVINGELMPIVGDGDYVSPISGDFDPGLRLRTEDLAGVEHEILMRKSGRVFGPRRIVVPEGHYFMVGDNRDNSSDSRVWGFVPEENLVGRATRIWLHMNGWWPHFGRFGQKIE